MEWIIGILVVFTLVREVLFQLQMNKLMNKLMSRNYHEYELSKNAATIYSPQVQSGSVSTEPEKIVLDHDTQMELNALNGIA